MPWLHAVWPISDDQISLADLMGPRLRCPGQRSVGIREDRLGPTSEWRLDFPWGQDGG